MATGACLLLWSGGAEVEGALYSCVSDFGSIGHILFRPASSLLFTKCGRTSCASGLPESIRRTTLSSTADSLGDRQAASCPFGSRSLISCRSMPASATGGGVQAGVGWVRPGCEQGAKGEPSLAASNLH